MSEPKWLTAEDVLALHKIQIERVGGSLGLRDKRRDRGRSRSPQTMRRAWSDRGGGDGGEPASSPPGLAYLLPENGRDFE